MGRTVVAVGIQLAILVLVLVPPLWVRSTGTAVFLETEKMDPRSLFRGHYVILGYKLAQGIAPDRGLVVPSDRDNTIYVKITTDRPAKFVAISDRPPDLGQSEACIVGRRRGRGGSVDFPQIAQFFAARDDARKLEGQRGEDLLADTRTDRRCNAVLLDLVPR